MLKRMLTGAVSIVLVIALLLTTACSTPDVAIRVNDKEISMGEYLAYVYETFYSAYFSNGLYQYAMYGYDVWDMEYSYGEGDDAKELKLADYLAQSGKDLAIRQAAVSELLEKYKLEWDEDDKKEMDEQLADVKESDLIALGFNKKNYSNAVLAVELNEPALFYGLYGEGGEREIAEEDIKEYYEENYLSYMSIEMSLQDEEGNDLSEEEIEKIEKQLKGYLEMYEESGDFDAVIEQYEKDTADEEEEETTDADTSDEDTADEDTADENAADEEEEEEEPTESENRIDTTVDAIGDENKSDAIKNVKIGKASIQQYKAGDTTPTMALILRLDPDKRVDGVDYYEENRKAIMQSLKYEELDTEIKEYIKEMDVEVNDRAVKMADPKAFAEAVGY